MAAAYEGERLGYSVDKAPEQAGHCCGAPGSASGGPPPALAWNGMKDWYTTHMSLATAGMGVDLLRHLGLLSHSSAASSKPVRVVETHCGDARAASELLPLDTVASYTACDFSDGMLGEATKSLGSKGTTVQADSAELPFEAASFDCYMSNLGCCCAADIRLKLKEARRVLAPGGMAAMSMRIGDFEGDTSFHLVASALKPFGFPPQPDREGLRIGKDLPSLRARLLEAGFSSPRAWRSWISVPVRSVEEVIEWSTSQPPVKKFLAGLAEQERAAALRALQVAAHKPADDGAMQMAVAVVVATVTA
eukprot:TRINITY_DN95703_c0_g1_i1.p1 TRINITY_DN95703_c0_g1~~TRINITY_DN95703_c0_g1_i1.p1  ORF type:complete len:306 (+),score=71.97 TRINITY_DN95703_c0_g1_i1:30-947(+)